MAVSSTDGFITFVTFSDGELGTPYHDQPITVVSRQELRQQEQERQQEKDKKRKAKEDKKNAKLKAAAAVEKPEEKVKYLLSIDSLDV